MLMYSTSTFITEMFSFLFTTILNDKVKITAYTVLVKCYKVVFYEGPKL